jgi:hypothetical protein
MALHDAAALDVGGDREQSLHIGREVATFLALLLAFGLTMLWFLVALWRAASPHFRRQPPKYTHEEFHAARARVRHLPVGRIDWLALSSELQQDAAARSAKEATAALHNLFLAFVCLAFVASLWAWLLPAKSLIDLASRISTSNFKVASVGGTLNIFNCALITAATGIVVFFYCTPPAKQQAVAAELVRFTATILPWSPVYKAYVFLARLRRGSGTCQPAVDDFALLYPALSSLCAKIELLCLLLRHWRQGQSYVTPLLMEALDVLDASTISHPHIIHTVAVVLELELTSPLLLKAWNLLCSITQAARPAGRALIANSPPRICKQALTSSAATASLAVRVGSIVIPFGSLGNNTQLKEMLFACSFKFSRKDWLLGHEAATLASKINGAARLALSTQWEQLEDPNLGKAAALHILRAEKFDLADPRSLLDALVSVNGRFRDDKTLALYPCVRWTP